MSEIEGCIDPVQEMLEHNTELSVCLDRLKETDRVIIVRHFWLGENHREIAGELGMNHGQVRQRFIRALSRLKKCMSHFLVSQSDSQKRHTK
jgi:RNA polymerase sigma factor (sigma-70 family)